MPSPRQFEEREVRAADPALSPETNAALTEELRDVVGADRVRVPADRPRPTRGEFPDRQGAGAYLNQHRFTLIRATAIVLTFGAIVALATGDWWILPLAAGVHALGTMTVVLTVIRLTTTTEHPSAELAASMAEEGVPSPDERFTHMVEEFSPTERGGTSEVLSPGNNTRRTEARTGTPAAAAEQSSAMTPTADPSEPAGEGGAPDVVIWSTVASLFVLSLVLPAVSGGGWMWLLPAVMVPLLVGWAVVQRVMVTHAGDLHLRGRALAAIAACTALAVAVFCALVALAFAH